MLFLVNLQFELYIMKPICIISNNSPFYGKQEKPLPLSGGFIFFGSFFLSPKIKSRAVAAFQFKSYGRLHCYVCGKVGAVFHVAAYVNPVFLFEIKFPGVLVVITEVVFVYRQFDVLAFSFFKKYFFKGFKLS